MNGRIVCYIIISCRSQYYFTVSFHTSRCSARDSHELISISLFLRFLLIVSLYKRRGWLRGRPRGRCLSGSCEQRTCLGRRSVGILKRCPVQRRFFLMRRSSIVGSPACLRTFYVSHFVLPSDLHDRPQMSHHESVQLLHVPPIHRPCLSPVQ